nr:MAG TPA: hypothetical protein [Caudoviricetes sp.]
MLLKFIKVKNVLLPANFFKNNAACRRFNRGKVSTFSANLNVTREKCTHLRIGRTALGKTSYVSEEEGGAACTSLHHLLMPPLGWCPFMLPPQRFARGSSRSWLVPYKQPSLPGGSCGTLWKAVQVCSAPLSTGSDQLAVGKPSLKPSQSGPFFPLMSLKMPLKAGTASVSAILQISVSGGGRQMLRVTSLSPKTDFAKLCVLVILSMASNSHSARHGMSLLTRFAKNSLLV